MVVEIVNLFVQQSIAFLPLLAGALIILVIGWIAGLVIGKIVRGFIRRIRADEYLARGKRPIFRVSDIFSVIFKWAVYLIFIQTAVDYLGVAALSKTLVAILGFVPGLIQAIVVIIVGYAIAEYIRSQIEESNVTYSEIISKVIFFLVVYMSVAMALPLLRIDPFIINALLIIVVGSLGAGMAIAIGLGLQDTIAEMAKKHQKKKKRR